MFCVLFFSIFVERNGLAEFDFDCEEERPAARRQGTAQRHNWCGTVDLVLASSYHGPSSSEKEKRILGHIREFLIDRLLAALNLSYVA